MLPADLDDDQRARLAHERPNNLDSSPSSLSSGTPTCFDTRRRSKLSSHLRSHTTADGSSNSHLLALVVSREEEVREIKAALVVITARLEAEATRANDAERRALDYFYRLRSATENRERAEQESVKLREELKLYKLRLEDAQKEIFRAQDIIDQVDSQRNEAVAEAVRAKTNARKLQEEKRMMLVREEGRRVGYREGLSKRRRIGHDEGSGRQLTGPSDRLPHLPLSLEYHDGYEHILELGEATSDEEPHVQLRPAASTRRQPMRSESAPPLPVPSRVVPVRVRTPSHEHRTPSPPRDEPETIHPIPIRPSPIISRQPISVPIDDGWIQRVNSRTSSIQVLPTHELQQPIPPSPCCVANEARDSRATQQLESTQIPPRDHADRTSPPTSRGHTPSIISRTSTHPSRYDIANKRPGSALRNEIYVGRSRSGSQPFNESTSRNEHHDQDRHNSSRTGAENNAEQCHADDDASPLLTPPRSFTPSALPRPHQPLGFHYEAQKIVMPPSLGDSDDPRPRRRIPTESTAARSHPPPADLASRPARTRSEIVTPTPLRDVDDPQPRRLVPPESAVRSRSPLADPVSRHARTQSEILTPTPLGDVNDPQARPRRRVPTESYAARSHSPPDDPVSNGAF
ncbi:hypothetical protein OG21DRAFT_1547180 [Imleria badia]|nr:hypothetical protein OG21DRAFT_1547180 [Imleria badia]